MSSLIVQVNNVYKTRFRGETQEVSVVTKAIRLMLQNAIDDSNLQKRIVLKKPTDIVIPIFIIEGKLDKDKPIIYINPNCNLGSLNRFLLHLVIICQRCAMARLHANRSKTNEDGKTRIFIEYLLKPKAGSKMLPFLFTKPVASAPSEFIDVLPEKASTSMVEIHHEQSSTDSTALLVHPPSQGFGDIYDEAKPMTTDANVVWTPVEKPLAVNLIYNVNPFDLEDTFTIFDNNDLDRDLLKLDFGFNGEEVLSMHYNLWTLLLFILNLEWEKESNDRVFMTFNNGNLPSFIHCPIDNIGQWRNFMNACSSGWGAYTHHWNPLHFYDYNPSPQKLVGSSDIPTTTAKTIGGSLRQSLSRLMGGSENTPLFAPTADYHAYSDVSSFKPSTNTPSNNLLQNTQKVLVVMSELLAFLTLDTLPESARIMYPLSSRSLDRLNVESAVYGLVKRWHTILEGDTKNLTTSKALSPWLNQVLLWSTDTQLPNYRPAFGSLLSICVWFGLIQLEANFAADCLFGACGVSTNNGSAIKTGDHTLLFYRAPLLFAQQVNRKEPKQGQSLFDVKYGTDLLACSMVRKCFDLYDNPADPLRHIINMWERIAQLFECDPFDASHMVSPVTVYAQRIMDGILKSKGEKKLRYTLPKTIDVTWTIIDRWMNWIVLSDDVDFVRVVLDMLPSLVEFTQNAVDKYNEGILSSSVQMLRFYTRILARLGPHAVAVLSIGSIITNLNALLNGSNTSTGSSTLECMRLEFAGNRSIDGLLEMETKMGDRRVEMIRLVDGNYDLVVIGQEKTSFRSITEILQRSSGLIDKLPQFAIEVFDVPDIRKLCEYTFNTANALIEINPQNVLGPTSEPLQQFIRNYRTLFIDTKGTPLQPRYGYYLVCNAIASFLFDRLYEANQHDARVHVQSDGHLIYLKNPLPTPPTQTPTFEPAVIDEPSIIAPTHIPRFEPTVIDETLTTPPNLDANRIESPSQSNHVTKDQLIDAYWLIWKNLSDNVTGELFLPFYQELETEGNALDNNQIVISFVQ